MLLKSLDQVKREHVIKVLIHHDWHLEKSAFTLKITVRSIRNFLYKNPDVITPAMSKKNKKMVERNCLPRNIC